LQDPPKFTHIGNFGLKIFRLATMGQSKNENIRVARGQFFIRFIVPVQNIEIQNLEV
jgi:hypothetical protein